MVVRRSRRLLLATAALVSFAACSGDDQAPVSTAADAGTPDASPPDAAPPEGCVDIRVDGRLLGGEHRGPITLGNDPFWRDELGLHIVWHAARTIDGSTSRGEVVVSSFDPDTGNVLSHTVLDAFPEGAESKLSVVYASSGSPDGRFVVAYGVSSKPLEEPQDTVAFFEPDRSTAVATWTPPAFGSIGGIIHVGWDGEAFAAHLYNSEALLIARVTADGTEVLAPEPFGSIGPLGDDYYSDMQTDPDTGETWVVSAGGEGVWVKGHLRDGTPLPGTSAEGGVFVQGEGLEWKRSGVFPSVSRGGPGALLSWDDGYYGTVLQLVDASLAPLTPAMVIPPDQATINSPVYYAERRTLCANGDGWWSAMANRKTVDSYRIASNLEVQREPLIAHSGLSCSETDTCDGGTARLDARKFSAVRWNDELWFGFHDYSDQALDDEQRRYVEPYRIVLVKPGCVYPSMYDVGMGLAQ